MGIRRLASLVALASALAAPAGALAGTTHIVEGAGFGHGVGLSQYGALGLAERGDGYRDILGRYYTDTTIDYAKRKTTRVLLQASRQPGASFTKAVRVGDAELDPGRRYEARPYGSGVEVLSDGGELVARFSEPVRARNSGDRSVRLLGLA